MSGNRSVARELFGAAEPADPQRGHQRALRTEMVRATRLERYIQDSIDALGRRGNGGPHCAPLPGRSRTWTCVYMPRARGRVVEEGPYDERRVHEESRFREMVKMQRL